MRVLISGITGFIGQNLFRKCEEKNIDVYAVIRDTTPKIFLDDNTVSYHIDNDDISGIQKFLQDNNIDGVIHLASCFIKEHMADDVSALIDSNVYFGTKLLEASSNAGINWFINTGSYWQHYENREYSPVNLYAATKQAFYNIMQYYTETAEMECASLELYDTYGPGDTRPKIFNLWTEIAETGETLDMSPGEQLIDLVYIDDVTDAYMQMITLCENKRLESLDKRVFTVSSGNPITLKQLAGIFETVSQQTLHINWGKRPYRKREVMVPWNSGEVLPDWHPRVSLQKGIENVLRGHSRDRASG